MMDSNNESKLWEYNTLPPNQEADSDDTQEEGAPLGNSYQGHEEGVLKLGAGINGGMQVNTRDMIAGGYSVEHLRITTDIVTDGDEATYEADPLDSITSTLDDEYPLDRLGEFPEYQLLMVDNQSPRSEKLRELLDGMSAAIEYKLRQGMKEREDAVTNEELKRGLMELDGNPAVKGDQRSTDWKEGELATKEYVDECIAKEKAATINYMVRVLATATCILVLVFATYYHR